MGYYTIRRANLSILVIVFLLTTPSFSHEINLTRCGLSKCRIECRCNQDVSISCEAIKRALQFFKLHGYEIAPRINIKFVKNVNRSKPELTKIPSCLK